ncbi:MAG: CcmD family protein [Saprospiraceae bacterium]|jgi:CcmD family protein|nr:CcmD family protein [Saprospiraceae bacterium]MBL0026322.1 CcmD family protein [Saprospiraceae bacterium]
MKKFIVFFILQIVCLQQTIAQSTDFLRSTGKIYSVVVIILVIFVGIIVFLFRLDNKLTKLEKQIKNEQ